MKTKVIPTETRTFQKFGKWVEKPLRSQILIDALGHKYIKTRSNQTSCVKCMSKNQA